MWNYVQNGLSPQHKKLPYLTARSRRTRNDTITCNPAAPAIPPPRAAHRHPQRYHGVKPATPTTIQNDHAPLCINKPPIFAALSHHQSQLDLSLHHQFIQTTNTMFKFEYLLALALAASTLAIQQGQNPSPQRAEPRDVVGALWLGQCAPFFSGLTGFK